MAEKDKFIKKLVRSKSSWNEAMKDEVIQTLENNQVMIENLRNELNRLKINEPQTMNDNTSQKTPSNAQLVDNTQQRAAREESSRGYMIDPNAPCYNGRLGENLEKWIAVIENNFIATAVPEDRKLNVIVNYVKGEPLRQLLKYQRKCAESNEQAKFNVFIEALLERDNSGFRKQQITFRLINFKQTGKLDDYIEKFQDLGEQTGLSEEDLLNFFERGLKRKFKEVLASNRPKSLEEAISLARIIDDLSDMNMERDQKQRGEKERRRGDEKKSNRNDKANIECFNCKKKGHYANKCYL